LHGYEHAAFKWKEFNKRGDLYEIPPHMDCDRNYARSQFGLFYLDRMTYSLEEAHKFNRTKVSKWEDLPLYQAMDFNKGFWFQHSHYRRALHAEKIFQKELGIYLPFDAFECEQYSIDELVAAFPAVLAGKFRALIEPMLSEDWMPPVVYYYGVQLSQINGLPEGHPRRLFLEDNCLRELVLIRVFMYYFNMAYNNRVSIQPPEVLKLLEEAGESGLNDLELYLDWKPRQIIEHMRAAGANGFNADPNNAYEPRWNQVFPAIYGLTAFKYHWVNGARTNLGEAHPGAVCPFTNTFNSARWNPIPECSSAIKAKGSRPGDRRFNEKLAVRNMNLWGWTIRADPYHKRFTTAPYVPLPEPPPTPPENAHLPPFDQSAPDFPSVSQRDRRKRSRDFASDPESPFPKKLRTEDPDPMLQLTALLGKISERLDALEKGTPQTQPTQPFL